MKFSNSYVLKLNASWIPIGFSSIKKVFPDMATGACIGLNLAFEEQENGEFNFDAPIESFPIKWDEWIDLPVRPYDDYIQTVNKKIRIPKIVICQHTGIPVVKKKLTKQAIFERDGYQCMYTGEKFNKKDARKHLNIDHVVPRDKGGITQWENLVACRKDINLRKSNKTVAEAGLNLIRKPFKPVPRPVSAEVYSRDPNEIEPQWRWLIAPRQ